MQTDPTAHHSLIRSFQRVYYLAQARALTGPPLQARGLCGQDSGHGGVDPSLAMTVFLGERLAAGASGTAGKQLGVGCR